MRYELEYQTDLSIGRVSSPKYGKEREKPMVTHRTAQTPHPPTSANTGPQIKSSRPSDPPTKQKPKSSNGSSQTASQKPASRTQKTKPGSHSSPQPQKQKTSFTPSITNTLTRSQAVSCPAVRNIISPRTCVNTSTT